MKIRMTANYSERLNDPQKGTVLHVFDTEYDDEGNVDFYVCIWEGGNIDVYPYECEEVK
ncbi:hypothetical protein SP40_92 [Salmonella phage 40]|nr:hypothetical protein SP40_92 [Salmonella phage 40]